MFRNSRKAADIAEQDGHLALFAAELQAFGVGGNLPDHLGRQIAVKGGVDIGPLLFFLAETQQGLDRVNQDQRDDRPCRIEQIVQLVKGQPAASGYRGRRSEPDRCADRGSRTGQQERQSAAEQQDQEKLHPRRPVGADQKLAEDHLLGGLRVDGDARLVLGQRCRDQIAQAGCAGADEDDLPLDRRAYLLCGHIARQQPPGRDRAFGCRLAEMHPQFASGRRRHLEIADPQVDDGSGRARCLAAAVAGLDQNRVRLLRYPQGFQRKRRHQLVLVEKHQRRSAQYPVGIADDAQRTQSGGRLLQLRQGLHRPPILFDLSVW